MKVGSSASCEQRYFAHMGSTSFWPTLRIHVEEDGLKQCCTGANCVSRTILIRSYLVIIYAQSPTRTTRAANIQAVDVPHEGPFLPVLPKGVKRIEERLGARRRAVQRLCAYASRAAVARVRRAVPKAGGHLAVVGLNTGREPTEPDVKHELPAGLPTRNGRHLWMVLRLEVLLVDARNGPRSLAPKAVLVGCELVLPRRPARLDPGDHVEVAVDARAERRAAEARGAEVLVVLAESGRAPFRHAGAVGLDRS
mmetsp:Transcript_8755/g.17313  ORF Transcript_8755/g.17313 Transcript_8755/m.17313 type:complete len:253 (+) Transcript_8755:99-857(+)|eukprot:5217413-Pleurochrysis_carterae.AAC.2